MITIKLNKLEPLIYIVIKLKKRFCSFAFLINFNKTFLILIFLFLLRLVKIEERGETAKYKANDYNYKTIHCN